MSVTFLDYKQAINVLWNCPKKKKDSNNLSREILFM